MSRVVKGGPARTAMAAALAAAVALSGCVTETKPDPAGPVAVPRRPERRPAAARKAPRPVQRPARDSSSPQPNDLTDPCAVRMHDLSGMLLMYYAVNKQLPGRVEELAPLADADVEFHADCPASSRPYVYAPEGLRSETGGNRSLILYDPVPAHGGLRWGVFVAPPRDRQPPATWVILMSEEVFRGYVPRGK